MRLNVSVLLSVHVTGTFIKGQPIAYCIHTMLQGYQEVGKVSCTPHTLLSLPLCLA